MDPSIFHSPLPGPAPSGPNLEYDSTFTALERAHRGRPEQVIGDAIKPGEEPDWHAVAEAAESLLGRTHDLRVALIFTQALLQTDGFRGLVTGLGIIRAFLEGEWNTVHPQLDAEDGDDPTARANALVGLAATDGLLKELRESPIVHSPTLGRFSLRAIRIASGNLPVPAGFAYPPQSQQVSAAFRDAKLPELESTAAAVSDALGHTTTITGLLADKLGEWAPDLGPLREDLSEINDLLGKHLRDRGVAAAAPVAPPAAPSMAKAAAPAAVNGDIADRRDVAHQLDRICEYYQRHEPSSPIPLLLQRAKRLVSKDFMTIIRDLAPSGLAEAESIGGVEKANE